MLNFYFALGVPLGLIILYIGIALFRKHSKIHYLGFVLFIIAGFMTAFCFQVLQYGWQLSKTTPISEITKDIGYPFWILYIPLILGLLLVVVNIYRGYRRVSKIRHIT